MGLKDAINDGLDAVKTGAANLKDAISEAGHRANAEGEQAKRNVAGDEMTPGEKATSLLRQGSESVKAGIDSAKRDVRSDA